MRKILYIIIATIAFFILGTMAILFEHERDLLLQSSSKHLHEKLLILGYVARLDMMTYDYSKVEENFISWCERDGYIISAMVSLESGFVIARYSQEIQHDDYLRVTETVPLFDRDKLIYTVDYSTDFIDKQARSLFIKLFSWGTVVMVLLVGSLWMLIYRMAVIPLNRLIEGAKKIGHGSLKHLIEIDSKDEFGRLASEFNLMSERLYDLVEKLKGSEQQQSDLLNNTSSVIYMKDLDGKYLFINRRYEDLFNVTNQDIMGKKDHDLFPQEMADAFRAHDLKVLSSDTIMEFEETVPQDDGEHIYISVKFPLRKYSGEIYAVCGISTDITLRKQSEKELLSSKKQLQISLHASNIGLWSWNLQTNEVDFSPEWKAQIGFEDDEIANRYEEWESRLHPADRKRVLSDLKDYMDGKKNEYAVEFWLRHKNGSYRRIFSRGEKLDDVSGETDYMMGCHIDITERKQMEEELLKAQKLESIGVLAGGIAHDFNNLLTAIINNLYLIKNHASSGNQEKMYERIEAAHSASVRAQGLTYQLLTFAKGGMPIKGLIDIRELVGESVSITLRGSNVICENLIPSDAWHIEADAGQISQAVNNILINADQAMPDGGTIVISCENSIIKVDNNLRLKEGRYIKLSIRDNGSGISDEDMSRIFDPYFTTKVNGNGLGLSTSYAIIKKHDGNIFVESKPGAGSVFNIYLPANREKVSIKYISEEETVAGAGRIVIMDDDVLVRESLGEILTAIGYIVDFASNGKEVIDIYKNAKESNDPVDAVIMDLTIPGGMGGKETISELIKIDPNVKAVVSSGYSNDPVMADFRKFGFSGVLKKPYKDITELSRLLSELTARP